MTPDHAYRPGQTPRHPEGTFDTIRASVRPGMDAAALAASPAFQTGLRWIDEGYYWEAHEVLEPVWMALPDGPDKRRVQALIQLANARLKAKMGQDRAAQRIVALVEALADERDAMGISWSYVAEKLDNMQYSA